MQLDASIAYYLCGIMFGLAIIIAVGAILQHSKQNNR